MSYTIRKISDKNIALDSPFWSEIEAISISSCNWDGFYESISTEARLVYNDDGIYVKFTCSESPVHINHRQHNGNVYMDSTVEFFIAPDINSTDYFNFEINAEGYALVGYGPGRERKRFADIDFSRFNIKSDIHENGFELILLAPFSFMSEYASEITKEMKGNLQKCCEVPGHTHYFSAYPIKTEKPEFHCPECFSDFTLE